MFKYPQTKICPRGQNVSIPQWYTTNVDNFLLHDNAIILHLESLKEGFAHNLSCVLKCRQDIYSFFNI